MRNAGSISNEAQSVVALARPTAPGNKYPLACTTFSEEEIDAAKSVLDSNRLTMGEKVAQFESDFATWTGSPFALMVNSGSSANLLMIDALLRRSRSKPPLIAGDEVIVPALSWPTTVWPLIQLGLVPIFVDIYSDTLSLDLESVEKSLSPRTRAIFLVHVLGQIPNMTPIIDFCNRHDLLLIEDVCEALGGHFEGTHAGNFGLMGSFSFYFSHHISTIEGGMIVTSDPDLYDDLKSLRAHGWVRNRSDSESWIQEFPEMDPRFLFIMSGYNVRPTEIQAAIGQVQLRKLDKMLLTREYQARDVHRLVKKYTPWMKLIGSERLVREPEASSRRNRTHSWMTLPFILQEKAPIKVPFLKNLFEQLGVETRPIIAGNLARHPAALAHHIRQAPSLQQCDRLLKDGFMIGCHPTPLGGGLEILETAFVAASRL